VLGFTKPNDATCVFNAESGDLFGNKTITMGQWVIPELILGTCNRWHNRYGNSVRKIRVKAEEPAQRYEAGERNFREVVI
jgi:hypothetical protein